MRAIVVPAFGNPDVLQVAEVPVPEPAAGRLRIKVAAASVNPVDLATRSGALAAYLPGTGPYPLGWDVAGTVDAVGEGVEGVRPGEAVIGLSDWFVTFAGTQAEYVVLPETAVAAAPAGAALAAAATLPLNGLTAAQALDLAGLAGGDTLVVVGAAGAVGGFAAQLAVHRGLKVYGVAGPGDRAFVDSTGAFFVPRGGDLAGGVRALVPGGADAVFDTAGLGGPAIAAVRDGGAYVGVFHPALPPAERDIRVGSVAVRSDPGRLAELVGLVETGVLTLRVAETFAFDDVAAAHEVFGRGGVRGRVVLVP